MTSLERAIQKKTKTWTLIRYDTKNEAKNINICEVEQFGKMEKLIGQELVIFLDTQ